MYCTFLFFTFTFTRTFNLIFFYIGSAFSAMSYVYVDGGWVNTRKDTIYASNYPIHTVD